MQSRVFKRARGRSFLAFAILREFASQDYDTDNNTTGPPFLTDHPLWSLRLSVLQVIIPLSRLILVNHALHRLFGIIKFAQVMLEHVLLPIRIEVSVPFPHFIVLIQSLFEEPAHPRMICNHETRDFVAALDVGRPFCETDLDACWSPGNEGRKMALSDSEEGLVHFRRVDRLARGRGDDIQDRHVARLM